MIDIASYLIKYFSEHDQEAAIPGLGVFYVDKNIESNKAIILFKEVAPKSKTFLNFLAFELNYTEEDSLEALNKWSKSVLKELKTKSLVTIPMIGTFMVEDGKVNFLPSSEQNLDNSDFGLEKEEVEESATALKTEEVEESGTTLDNDKVVPSVDKEIENTQTDETLLVVEKCDGETVKEDNNNGGNKSIIKWLSILIVLLMAAIIVVLVVPSTRELILSSLSINTEPTEIVLGEHLENEDYIDEDFYLDEEDLQAEEDTDVLSTEEEDAMLAEQIKQHELARKKQEKTLAKQVKAKKAEEKKVVKKDVIEQSSSNYAVPIKGKFYIVAGSFSNADNAERALKKFMKPGFEPEVLHNRAKDLYMVSLKTYSDREKAWEFRTYARENGVDCWIFEQK